MLRLFHALFILFVITLLNGCWFSKQDSQRWDVAVQGATSSALSRDGRFALIYSEQDHLLLWDLQANQQLRALGQLDPQGSIITHIRFADNQRYAITAGQQHFATWDLTWDRAQGLWSISDGIILAVDISANGEQALLGLSNGKAIAVNLVTGRRLEFLAHQEKVTTVALSANGRYALTGGNDRNAYFWDTQNGQVIHQFAHQQRINKVALQRDGLFAFSSDIGNRAVIWDLTTGQQKSQLHSWARQLVFSSVRFSDDGHYLLTGMASSRVNIWDTDNGDSLSQFDVEPLKDARPPRAVVYDATFDKQGRVITTSSAGIIQAWHVEL